MGSSNIAETILRIEFCLLLGLVIKICVKKKKKENRLKTRIEKPLNSSKEVQVGNDQEKAQSENDSHSKNRGGKNKLTIRY